MTSTSEAGSFGLPDAFSSTLGDLSLLTAFEDLAGHFASPAEGPGRCAERRTIVAFGRLADSSNSRPGASAFQLRKVGGALERSFGTVTPAGAWGVSRAIGLTDGTDFRDARTADFVGFRFRPETYRL